MPTERRLNAYAWLSLVTALALHVLDEAANDFLPLYNETVERLRQTVGFGPPTFTFGSWLGGLIAGIVVGYLLTPWIARGGKAPRLVATVFGVLMTLNGLLHIGISIYRAEPMPGVLSSPLLIAAATWLSYRGLNGTWVKEPAG